MTNGDEYQSIWPIGFAQLFLILPLAVFLFPFVRLFQGVSVHGAIGLVIGILLAMGLSLGFLSPYFYFQVWLRRRCLEAGMPDSSSKRAAIVAEIVFFLLLCRRGLVLGLLAIAILFFCNR